MKDLIKTLETRRMLSIAYYPQTDDQIEQINQEVKVFLRHYVKYQQNNQMEWLVAVKFQYNSKRHTATEKTPFELNFGQHLWKENLTIKTELPKLENFL